MQAGGGARGGMARGASRRRSARASFARARVEVRAPPESPRREGIGAPARGGSGLVGSIAARAQRAAHVSHACARARASHACVRSVRGSPKLRFGPTFARAAAWRAEGVHPPDQGEPLASA
eukprot:252489-Pleurochrysis_carterae.AAC.2